MTDTEKPADPLPPGTDLSTLLHSGVYRVAASHTLLPRPIDAHFKVYPDPDPVKLALESFTNSFSQQMKDAAKRTIDALNGMARTLENAGVIEPAPPSDPKERALWLRKNRNTGPEKKLNRRNRKP